MIDGHAIFGTDISEMHHKVEPHDEKVPADELTNEIHRIRIEISCWGDDSSSAFVAVRGYDQSKCEEIWKRIMSNLPLDIWWGTNQ